MIISSIQSYSIWRCHDDNPRAIGNRRLIERTGLEGDQVINTGGDCVSSGRPDGCRVPVCCYDLDLRTLHSLLPSFSTNPEVVGFIIPLNMHEPKIVSQRGGRAIHRHHGRLYSQSTTASHQVDHMEI